MSRRMSDGLSKASGLLDEKKPAEALKILLDLDRTGPDEPEVVVSLINAYYDLQDAAGYEQAVRRLVRMEPRNRDAALMLVAAFLSNGRPALALRACQDFLRRWPTDERSPEVHQQVTALQAALDDIARQSAIPEDSAWDVLFQHDEIRYALDHGMYEQARMAGEKLLKRFPRFLPVLNNLSTVYAVLGEPERALVMEQQVLEMDPQNFHAHANMARLLFLNGREEEARAAARGLADYPVDPGDRWAKTAETLSFLGDDAGVLALYEQARQAGVLDTKGADAFFYHLVGVSACRMGDEALARACWEKALQLSPGFDRSQANLADLDLPVAEREGPWAFPFEEWWLGKAVQDFSTIMEREHRGKGKGILEAAVCGYLDAHPQVVSLAPHMLERGENRAREFVFIVAAVSGQEKLVGLAKDFIFGKKGSFKLRGRGAQLLSTEGRLPNGPVKLWAGDTQRSVLLINTVISPEATLGNLTKATQDLLNQAYEAMTQNRPDRSRALLEKALALQPDEPILLYNLASTLGQVGETKKSDQMIADVHARFPDYFFGSVGAARLALQAGDLPTAHDLLNGLLQREKMHTAEFTALCVGQLDVWLAENNLESARSWLEMLSQVSPQHPAVEFYRERLEQMGKG